MNDAEGNKTKVAQFIHICLAGSKISKFAIMNSGEDKSHLSLRGDIVVSDHCSGGYCG